MIQDSVNKVIYAGNGLATEFAYPFEITKNTDVKVMTVSPDGVETVLTNDYYVDVEHNTVVYPGWAAGEEPDNADSFLPLDDGWKLVIYRQADYTQEIAMFDQHPFKAIEQMIDKVTILIQQLKDETERAMRLGISVDNADVNMTIPYAAGKSFRWSDDGKSLVVTKDPARVEESVQGWLAETERQASIAAEKANAAGASEIAAKASEQRAQEIADSIVENIDKAESNAQAAAASESAAKANLQEVETIAGVVSEHLSATTKNAEEAAKSAEEAADYEARANENKILILGAAEEVAQNSSIASSSAARAIDAETVAITKASEAGASAINAKASETNASTSAGNAKASANNAAASATAAAASAANVFESAVAAGQSMAAAKVSETNASASATAAAASEDVAKSKAQEATTQAASAKASAEAAEAAKNETFDGNWKPNEQVKVGDIRFLGGRENVGYVLECIQAGTTGATQPTFTEDDVEPEPFIEAVNVYATATYINKE